MPAYADSQEEEFTVHLNSNSLDINKYVRELAGKLYKGKKFFHKMPYYEIKVFRVP